MRDLVKDWRRLVLFDLEEGMRLMYSDVYRLRERRCFEVVDVALASLPVDEFPNAFLIGLLTITASMSRQLAERQGFYQRCYEKMNSSVALIGLACEEGWLTDKAI
jgi:hypothetical protein